ncbi:MAG: molybdopterin-dependent oxidoreductase [Solirubrobacterales bacterium]|nr:molybdopterin-dependent oxidoreductase [Solirubrobacterales bacterium]
MSERTLCPYCGVGCGLRVSVDGGRVSAITGDDDYPVNRGRTCRKPLELAAAVHAPDRATKVLKRAGPGAGFESSTWDVALAELGSRLAAYAPEEIGFYISGQLLTEDYYAVNKLAKGFLGTNNVDSNSRLCMSSAVAGYSGAFGFDGPPCSYEDIDVADCFLLLGSNTAACHPIVFSRIRDRQREGASIICLDPRATPTARAADLHVPLAPGTDLAFLNAMLCVLDAEGLLDQSFIAAHVSGFEEVLSVAREWTPERAAEVCRVPAALVVEAANRFGSAGAAMALWSMGANQSTVGTLKNRALINLCLGTGNFGRAGAGPFSLTGQPNAMGGRETGGLAHLLPGYRRIDDPAARRAVAEHWGVRELDPTPGLPAVEMFEPGRLKAIWIVATNPVVSMPDSARVREALRRAELVVVQDAHHPTETSAFADYVLPAAAWPEKEGTMTNSERRVGLVRKLLNPPGDARPDWQIFAGVAAELGHAEAFAWPDAAAVYAEYAALTANRPNDVSGLTHSRLRRSGQGVQWPCPAPGHPGTARLYAGGVVPGAPDGRAVATGTPHTDPAETPDAKFPLLLTTGRVADQWHTMSRTGKSERLRAAAGDPLLEIHPDDAKRCGVKDGGHALVRSRRGELSMRVKVTDAITRGVVFAPFHWGGLFADAGSGALNAVSHPSVDPTSKQPELKAIAVSVAATVRNRPVRSVDSHSVARLTRELVIVGTGMAGMAVAEEVVRRRSPAEWHVTMLGAEPARPYNRIMVSKLLAGTLSRPDLDLKPVEWFDQRRISLETGVSAEAVDTDAQVVHDSHGNAHRYDALVIATGSRPFVPPVPGVESEHVHSFRTVDDVAELHRRVDAGGRRAVVVGGGLLGLEAAAGRKARGASVTVIERGDRLMPAQLNAGAGALLYRELAAQGFDLRVSCSVAGIEADAVLLDDGERIDADLVVMAAGVAPETGLAQRAGLRCGRGIVVDDELRTSAPHVYAVGECAEHAGRVYGLWAPLAEQARVAGAVLVGDPGAFRGLDTATTLKVAGVELFAGGEVEGGLDRDEVVVANTREGRYRRLLLHGDRLAGAILLGDAADGPTLGQLLRTGEPVPQGLLDGGGSPNAPDPSQVVCSCNSVTRGTICDAITQSGCDSVTAVGEQTRAGTGCGSCQGEIQSLISSAGNMQDALAKPAGLSMDT